MPHLLPHPHPYPRSHRALARPGAVVLALLAAALTACTHAATSTPQPTPTGADVVDLTGAGSTFDAPFFDLAFPAYQQAHLYTGVSASHGTPLDAPDNLKELLLTWLK